MNDKKAKQLRRIARQLSNEPTAYDIQQKNVLRGGKSLVRTKMVLSPLCQRRIYQELKKSAQGINN